MTQVSAATVMRHPLASKRYIMAFRQGGEETLEVFELLSRYEAVGPIGQGTYGYVCSARDNTLVECFQLDPPPEYESEALSAEEKEDLYDGQTLVAVKKLRQLFENNQPRMWLCATREIQLMMSFHHDNVMSASDFYIPLGGVESLNYASILHLQHTFDSVYVVMKKMDYTLREVMDSVVVTPRDIAEARASAAAEGPEGGTSSVEGEAGALQGVGLPTPPEGAAAPSAVGSTEREANTGDGAMDMVIDRQALGSASRSPTSPGCPVGVPGACGASPTTASPGGGESASARTNDRGGDTENTTAGLNGKGSQASEGRQMMGASDAATTTATTTTTATAAEDEPLLDPRTGLPLHPLQRDYRKFILYQILRGVGYLHRCPVIHRDLKPENIMLDRSYNTCITDFGQGRDVGVLTRRSALSHPSGGPTATPNAGAEVLEDLSFAKECLQTVLDNTTQWYAAPETLTLAVASTGVGFIDHETFHGVDVWSVGCIAAEMLTGRPLFHTTAFGGIGQLVSIINLLGEPREDVLAYICELRDERSRDLFVAAISRVIEKFKGRVSLLKTVLKSPYGDEDADEVELITRCLAWDPRERITIQEALESPYFVKDGYEPVIDPEDTAKRVPSVLPEDISEPVSGRAFLWDLFVQRHPEFGELWNSLLRKREETEGSERAVDSGGEGGTDRDAT